MYGLQLSVFLLTSRFENAESKGARLQHLRKCMQHPDTEFVSFGVNSVGFAMSEMSPLIPQ